MLESKLEVKRGRLGSRFHKVLSSARWERVRRRELERAGWRCEKCGKAGALEVHHVRELHRGGAPFDLSNLQVLCRPCHLSQHRRPLSPEAQAWRRLVREMVDGCVRLLLVGLSAIV